jgi:hypothetical protein
MHALLGLFSDYNVRFERRTIRYVEVRLPTSSVKAFHLTVIIDPDIVGLWILGLVICHADSMPATPYGGWHSRTAVSVAAIALGLSGRMAGPK